MVLAQIRLLDLDTICVYRFRSSSSVLGLILCLWLKERKWTCKQCACTCLTQLRLGVHTSSVSRSIYVIRHGNVKSNPATILLYLNFCTLWAKRDLSNNAESWRIYLPCSVKYLIRLKPNKVVKTIPSLKTPSLKSCLAEGTMVNSSVSALIPWQ